jgi:Raf kinase inhibitor-like YbhB/YbcL family protein
MPRGQRPLSAALNRPLATASTITEMQTGKSGMQRTWRGRALAIAPALALLALVLAVSGCGGGSSTSTGATTVTVSSLSGTAHDASLTSGAVANVAGVAITKAGVEHWLAVTTALSSAASKGTSTPGASTPSQALKNQTLAFLISSQWVLSEAAAKGISVSEAAIHKRFTEIEHEEFKQPGELKTFMSKSGETMADLLLRVKIELLESAISQRVTASKHSSAEKQAALAAFQAAFQKRWKAKTTCKSGYVVEDCKEYKGVPGAEAKKQAASVAAARSSSSSVATSASRSSASRSGAAAATGETYSAPGQLALSSPAFERNAELPAKYTCDGANVSPPMKWENIPKGTVELVLFVIDDTTQGTAGGIRWVVAGIEPNTTEIKEGTTPPGAIVGRNGSGTASYGGICPAKGKTAQIEFVTYALKQKISLTTGFTPGKAESEYGGHELGSATDYATYTRP